MKIPGLQTRRVAACGLMALSAFFPLSASAQTPQTTDQAIAQLVAEITAQTRQIEANQREIEARVAKVEEAVRQARIFAARSGSRGGAKK